MKRKKKPQKIKVSLPTERSEALENLEDYSILIYGREKIGKTTLFSRAKRALFLFFEPGGKNLKLYARHVRNWRQFVGYVDLLEKDGFFRNVVIDTVDLCHKRCQDATCKKWGMDHPSDEGYGKGWGLVKDEFLFQMIRLHALPKGVIFLSHETEKEIKTRKGEQHRIIPSMSKQAREVLEPMVDIWGRYAYNKEGKRTLQIVGDDLISAGHRLQDHFVGFRKIPMGNSADEAYRNFVDAFNNRPVKGGKKKKRVLIRKK